MLKVSILLAVYNSELYLKDAIESVLLQSYFNFELVVVLNGCSDDSEAIVKDFVDLDDRVKMYVLSEKGKNLAYIKHFMSLQVTLYVFLLQMISCQLIVSRKELIHL